MIKTENWNGHDIRFVERESEWWAVAKDVANALGYRDAYNLVRSLEDRDKGTHSMSTSSGKQEVAVITEEGVYEVVLTAAKNLRNKDAREAAKEFKRWVFSVIKELRQASGFEGFQVFRMMDKDHQKEAMQKLRNGLKNPIRVDFIKANVIANKATSNISGYPKMLKKADMSPEMLIQRQIILEDTVNLMTTKESFGLDLSVSETVYNKYKS